MKLIDLVEAKKKMAKPSAPRAKHLHDVMAGRKGGAHYDAKADYKRSKEKEKARKEITETTSKEKE